MDFDNGDGGCAVVPCGMVTVQEKAWTCNLLPGIADAAGDGRAPDQERPFPVFELGTWRFTVRTRDPALISDLREYAHELGSHPRAGTRFTVELVRCTGEGRLPGWAWQKERVPG